MRRERTYEELRRIEDYVFGRTGRSWMSGGPPGAGEFYELTKRAGKSATAGIFRIWEENCRAVELRRRQEGGG